ncbi:flagellar hook assembly protein FlgD [Neobacillus sp. PS3-34]|uniref:flagellar hook assembly protein FlgD n=1 Tax=Neobacillus sp. PS3-34 TaxID=3070678 RepID=UPI0027E05A67|nr:flagellar hook assembly protein FlgD [Neobacillus sp. PS3-34]WML49278.1 flagellar hook assembly protein FlgD [Neobacillus sp. PS3-34]
MANSIDSSLLLKTVQNQTRKAGNGSLGKDDFLKILMTQLQNQDPLNPLQDKDFVAQMATFSTLEQITNMGKSIDQFVTLEQQNKLIAYNQFVGKEITWHKILDSEGGSGAPAVQSGTGKVASVQFKEDKVLFTLEDGTTLEPGNVSQINESSKDSQLLQSSMLIGKTVTFLNDAKEEKTAIVKSVSFKDGKTLFQLNDEGNTSISSTQITKIE